MALVFTTTATAMAGNPIHVTVRNDVGDPVDNASVNWSNIPATCMITPDADTASGGFTFVSSVVGVVSAKATMGAATATIILNFTGLKFTVP